jgi:hypothetical protein
MDHRQHPGDTIVSAAEDVTFPRGSETLRGHLSRSVGFSEAHLSHGR